MGESINEPLVYHIGDEVKIRVSFTHGDHIVAVEVVYALEGNPSYTLCLSGNPTLEEGSPTVGSDKRSTVELSAVWDAAHAPGRYQMIRDVYYNFDGHAIFGMSVAAGLDDVKWPELEFDPDLGRFEITEITPLLEDVGEPET